MPTVTDWLMVGITFVYVIATIFICIFNGRSAKATKEQVAESQRQFEEARRLEMMPYLQFDSSTQAYHLTLDLLLVSNDMDGGTYTAQFRIKNIGHGTARDITYTYAWHDGSQDKGPFPVRALQAGDEQYLAIAYAMPNKQYGNIETSFELSFSDLLGTHYTQKIQFKFGYNSRTKRYGFIGCTTNPPSVRKENSNA